MAKFTDKQGRDWIVRLDYDTVTACEQAGIDILLERFDGSPDDMLRQLESPMWIANALYPVCKEQADELQIDKSRFCDSIRKSRKDARTALLEAQVDFFRESEMEAKAIALETLLLSLPEMESQAMEAAETARAKLSTEDTPEPVNRLEGHVAGSSA